MADDSINNYLNTLIFCIIAKAFTVGLLVLLITDLGWDFVFLIMTIEIGLVLIVFYALYTVYKIEKMLKKAKEDHEKEQPNISTCPDYYVRETIKDDSSANNGHIICKNVYDTSDKRYTYTFPMSDTIDLTSLTKPHKTWNDMCNQNKTKYDNISWTDLKARCNILDTYSPS